MALSGATIYDHAPVYVLVMTGGTFEALEQPPGALPTEGSVLAAVVNAATYDATDVHIVTVEPDSSSVELLRVDISN